MITQNKIRGKKARDRGKRFEDRIREHLEKEGWNVCRYMNTVEFKDSVISGEAYESLITKPILTSQVTKPEEEPIYKCKYGKLVPAKPHSFRGRIVNMFAGKPDFIAYRINIDCEVKETPDDLKSQFLKSYEIIGIEAKKNKYLDKEEKEIFKWQLENNIFSKILIFYNDKGKIKFYEFKI